jgi:hypothetical protein
VSRREEVGIDVVAHNLAKSALRDAGGDLKNVGDEADHADKKVGGFASGFKSMASGALMGVGMGALNMATNALSGLVDGIVGGAAEMEKYNTQFTVFLGSADKAKTRMAELAKFAQVTPFELPEVVNADKVLTAFGIHSERTLKNVGDAAAGSGANFGELATTFGRISAGAYGEAFMRLAELGIATRKDLEGQGLKFDKGGSYIGSAKEAMEAVNKIVESRFGGMMEKQSQTLEGQWSNVQDMIGATLRGIGEAAMPIMKGGLQWLLDVGPQISVGIQGAASVVIPALAGIAGGATALLAPIRDVAGLIGGLFSDIASESGDLGVFSDDMREAFGIDLGPIVDLQRSLDPLFASLTNLWTIVTTQLGPALMDFAKNVWEGGLNKAVNAGIAAWSQIEAVGVIVVGAIVDIAAAIASNKDVLNALSVAGKVIGAAFGIAADALTMTMRAVGDFVAAVQKNRTVMGILEAVGKGIADTFRAVFSILADVVDKVVAFATAASTNKAAMSILSTIGSGIESAFKAAYSAVDGVIGIIRQAVQAAKDAIDTISKIPGIKLGGDVVGNIGGAIGNAVGMLPGFADGGIVPGAMGSPQVILAHGGERVQTIAQQAASSPTTNFNVTIQASYFAGSEADARSFARQMYDYLADEADRRSGPSSLAFGRAGG